MQSPVIGIPPDYCRDIGGIVRVGDANVRPGFCCIDPPSGLATEVVRGSAEVGGSCRTDIIGSANPVAILKMPAACQRISALKQGRVGNIISNEVLVVSGRWRHEEPVSGSFIPKEGIVRAVDEMAVINHDVLHGIAFAQVRVRIVAVHDQIACTVVRETGPKWIDRVVVCNHIAVYAGLMQDGMSKVVELIIFHKAFAACEFYDYAISSSSTAVIMRMVKIATSYRDIAAIV